MTGCVASRSRILLNAVPSKSSSVSHSLRSATCPDSNRIRSSTLETRSVMSRDFDSMDCASFCVPPHRALRRAPPTYCWLRRSPRAACASQREIEASKVFRKLSVSAATRDDSATSASLPRSAPPTRSGPRTFPADGAARATGRDDGSAAAPPARRAAAVRYPAADTTRAPQATCPNRVPRDAHDRAPIAQSTGPTPLSEPASGKSRGCLSFPDASGNRTTA